MKGLLYCMITNTNVTICTVSSFDHLLLNINLALIRRLNPKFHFSCVVAINTPAQAGGEQGQLDPECRVVTGFHQTTDLLAQLYNKENRPNGHPLRNVYHASGLIQAVRASKTRYILVLDPDFYVVRHNWISECLDYMTERNLTFFGAPLHPITDPLKVRYFPTVYCLFIDTEKVKIADLSFDPPSLPDQTHLYKQNLPLRTRMFHKIFELFDLVSSPMWPRHLVGYYGDTGFSLMKFYENRPGILYECISPVFRAEEHFGVVSRLLDSILPDKYSLTPKRIGYCSREGFKELGLGEPPNHSREEYVWRGSPFGFHLRSSIRSNRGVNVSALQKFLESI